jgi:hypothetical protein
VTRLDHFVLEGWDNLCWLSLIYSFCGKVATTKFAFRKFSIDGGLLVPDRGVALAV